MELKDLLSSKRRVFIPFDNGQNKTVLYHSLPLLYIRCLCFRNDFFLTIAAKLKVAGVTLHLTVKMPCFCASVYQNLPLLSIKKVRFFTDLRTIKLFLVILHRIHISFSFTFANCLSSKINFYRKSTQSLIH